MQPDLTTSEELQAPLQKKSLKDDVFDLLHSRIVAGQVAPGEWLRQEEIASQLGVSQTPVREALDLLVSVGLAERVPYRGVRVPELVPTELVDSFVTRVILECAVVRLAAHNASTEQVARLRELVDQSARMLTLEDMSSMHKLNKQIHMGIAAASGNPLMGKMYEMCSNLFPDWMLYEAMFRHPELLASSLEREFQQHKAVVEAIAAGDADCAVGHALEHLADLQQDLVNFLGIPADELEARVGQVRPLL
jgi:DNA-binding GntR family transcriptional regulator